jgi:3-oxoacyl-[acyl-carrier protein] reductase
MRKRRWERVIYLTSVAAKQPIPSLILSNTARSGLAGYAKTLASDCAEYNVLVNVILTGHFATDRAVSLAKRRAERAGRLLLASAFFHAHSSVSMSPIRPSSVSLDRLDNRPGV